MYTDEQLASFDKQKQVNLLRWYNLSYKTAVEKCVQQGTFSKYIGNKLLEPLAHLERQRVPTRTRNV